MFGKTTRVTPIPVKLHFPNGEFRPPVDLNTGYEYKGPGLACFDFDQTLTTAVWYKAGSHSTANPNPAMLQKMEQHKAAGNTVHIVTARGTKENSRCRRRQRHVTYAFLTGPSQSVIRKQQCHWGTLSTHRDMIMSYAHRKMECVGFEHLHLHTDFSLLDGYGMVEEYAAHWKAHGDYLCISDHGMMAAIPRQIKACEASGKKTDPHKNKRLNPIFACELYVNPLQIEAATPEDWNAYKKSLSPEQLKKLSRKGYHLLAIAYNQKGYSNLVQLSSLAWTKGYYYGRPRLNHEQLVRHKEGIIFTSCCYASEVGRAFDEGGEEPAFAMIEKYRQMFGENYFLEVMLLDFKKQKPYDAFIVKAHQRYNIPIILTNDCHYCQQEDSQYQRLMLMVQTRNTIKDIEKKMREEGMQDFFELQDQNLWMKTEEELNEKWAKDYQDVIDYDIFKQAKLNAVEICRRARGVQLDRSIKLPQIPDANHKLWDAVMEGARQRGLPLRDDRRYLTRIREEYPLICRKEFSSYFLIQKMMTDEARRVCGELLGWGDGSQAVGPGRGSAVGSLVCYCLGITDVDPIRHNLLFKRFLSEARGGKSMKLRFHNLDPLVDAA